MPINGITSTLPDPQYIAALEARLAELQRQLTNLQASVRTVQNR